MRSVIPKREVRRAGAAGPPLNVAALEAALREVVRGEVRFSDGDRALYATDASNYRQTPIGVVLPRDKRDVIQAVAVCHHYGAPVLARGGGTSLAVCWMTCATRPSGTTSPSAPTPRPIAAAPSAA